ncbi:zinc-binding protein A33-like isoform X1 [Mustelus asterias]
MASRQHEESWTRDTICRFCLDFFINPVMLQCGHNFCHSCITQHWEKKKARCPECGEKFPEINLRLNRALANLAEKARKLKLNRKEKENKLHCEEHQEELKLFCETDKKLVCVNCVVSQEHREHRFIAVKEAAEIYKNQVKSSLDSLTEKKSTVLEMEQQQKQKISQIRKQSISLQSHITSEFTKMHQILTEKEQRLIRDLREEEEKNLKPMEENLCEIQENLNSIQENLSKLEKQLEQKDGVIFLKKKLEESMSGVQRLEYSTEETSRKRRIRDLDNRLSLVDGVLPTGTFNGSLPFPVWREMLDSINPVSVTLDVKTANPHLEVSEDLKSLRRTRLGRSLSDTVKRFTHYLSVLGSEGFTSGKHYWAVEVTGNQGWILGVAAESVERKGGVKLMPETGFWTIGQFDDQFHMNSSPPSSLPVSQVPGKVGVYLSYESGTISFYNADTTSHLHTFIGNKFTQKLYPFFWTRDENQWLRICSSSDPDSENGRGLGVVASSLISQ